MNHIKDLIIEFLNLDEEEIMLMLDESIYALMSMKTKTSKEKRLVSKLVNMRNVLL
jgi:hypothetical protein